MNKIIPSLVLLLALNTAHYCWTAQASETPALAPLLQEDGLLSQYQEEQCQPKVILSAFHQSDFVLFWC